MLRIQEVSYASPIDEMLARPILGENQRDFEYEWAQLFCIFLEFLPVLEELMNEDVLIGQGYTVRDVLR